MILIKKAFMEQNDRSFSDIKTKTLSDCDEEEKNTRLELIRAQISPILEKIKWRCQPLKRDPQFPSGRPLLPDQKLGWSNLVFIRTTDFPPQINERKQLLDLPTSLESSGTNYYGRRTQHFTLNHKVASHMMGNWEGTPLLYVIPGKSMVQQNGKPECLLAVDTFYVGGTVLPEGSVIIINKNFQLDIPEEIKNKYFIIYRDEWMTHEEILGIVFNYLQITKIEASEHEAVTENFPQLLEKFRKKEKIPMATHHNWTWPKALDDFLNELALGEPERAMSIFYLFGKSVQAEPGQAMPRKQQIILAKELASILAISPDEYVAFLAQSKSVRSHDPNQVMTEVSDHIKHLFADTETVNELKRKFTEAQKKIVQYICFALLAKKNIYGNEHSIDDSFLIVLVKEIKKEAFGKFGLTLMREDIDLPIACTQCNWGFITYLSPKEIIEQYKKRFYCPICNSPTYKGMAWQMFVNLKKDRNSEKNRSNNLHDSAP